VSDLSTAQLEIFVGRSLAFCAHPLTAWRVVSRRWRFLMVFAYFVAAYATILSTLLVL
jgi:hypothetical protein